MRALTVRRAAAVRRGELPDKAPRDPGAANQAPRPAARCTPREYCTPGERSARSLPSAGPGRRRGSRGLAVAGGLLCVGAVACLLAPSAAAQFAVSTHHYDNYRTGWNSHETRITSTSFKDTTVASQRFGFLRSVSVDGGVDAQPLVVPDAVIAGDPNAGSHDVVFLATENNTVYAIDPTRGTVLNSRNLGPPVKLPLGCPTNPAHVGINSTPVIDLTTNSLYVIAYLALASGPAYELHRLALRDFSDIVPPVTVAATHTLSDGSTASFMATYERQRAALLLSGGGVYAAFASFCDHGGAFSRGWLLGWRSRTLAPLRTNTTPGTIVSLLTNKQARSPNTFFLSSIWMSGAGPATDEEGNIFVVTGNSDPSGTTYDGVTNLQESVVKFDPANNQVLSLFTPFNVQRLDEGDADFGAGGVVVVHPAIAGLPTGLAVAAGKVGTMFLMSRSALGGYNGPNGPDKVVGSVRIGRCWCEPSYYYGDAPKIVSSGGNILQVWTLSGGAGGPLVPGPKAVLPLSLQDGGFFTSISTNGRAEGIIWAVPRPASRPPLPNLMLYAFSSRASAGATELAQLYAGPAGSWITMGADANIVPVVANGMVYVASFGQLSIFGLGGTP